MPREDPASVRLQTFPRANFSSSQATLVADGAKKVVFQYVGAKKGSANGTDYLVARWRGLAETDPLRLEFDDLARRDVAAAAADELPVDRLQRVPDPGLVNLPTIWPRMRFPSASRLRGVERRGLFPAFRYAQPECGVRYPYGSKLGLFKGRVGGGVRDFERFASVSSETRVRERLDAFDSTPRPRETSARSSASAAASGPSAPRGPRSSRTCSRPWRRSRAYAKPRPRFRALGPTRRLA